MSIPPDELNKMDFVLVESLKVLMKEEMKALSNTGNTDPEEFFGMK